VSNSLFDILKDKDFDEPQEVQAIKQYVERHYKSTIKVQVRQSEIIITAPSAALASTLRMEQSQIKYAANTKKKLLFRIG
jgi:hypothetical protein